MRAERRGPGDRDWLRFERGFAPKPDVALPTAGAGLARALGELLEFSGTSVWLVANGRRWRESFLPRLAASDASPTQLVLGLEEWSALWNPVVEPREQAAHDPSELRAHFSSVAAQVASWPAGVARVAITGLASAWKRAVAECSPLTQALELALALLDCWASWADGALEFAATSPRPVDGLVQRALGARSDWENIARHAAHALEPRCAVVGRHWEQFETVHVNAPGKLELEDSDLELVDRVFEQVLPDVLRETSAMPPGATGYRQGQHQVAREIARVLGRDELLLVAAPTGTGKTLAYLVPAMIWAVRNGVRVGVSTYTRALQEQAASKEVPRALKALARAANLDAPRVSVLKGRGNYLCWRALRALDPSDEDSSHAWLAWTSLVVFAGIHAEADLDRFALRPALFPGEEWQAELYRELETVVAGARASGMCCIAREDRDTCAAELARQRAERSHVVITNHAFVLARQGFFRHLIADECEHLHEQAHGAWSHELSLRRVHSVLDRLGGKRRKSSRALLARLERQPGLGELLAQATQRAQAQRGTAQHAAEQLEQSLEGFKFWREQARQTREERDLHSLLREFVEQCGELPAAAALVECQRALWEALHLLEVDLSDIVERLQALKQPGLGGLRRGLELARADLVAMQQALEAWIPLEGNPPHFLAETFYDLETDARGQDSMVARVLLPNEFLGRKFLPELASGVLLSATTWLRGGFEAALGYLGLDRAAHPAPDEERDPRVVRTFRAPDPFDYSNVVVCIPRDAPAVTAGKDAVLSYVRRFLAHLGERTRGRILALFTNADDLKRVGLELEPFFAAKGIPFWYQNMPGQRKEELASLFRDGTDSILLGVDTFWFGADFPGESLEYLVIVRLPYGVPDQYHHAQCAALGAQEQRRRIYLPRALSKFRQGFGRLMRRESDRGAVFVLDSRILDGRHRFFLSELPLAAALAGTAPSERGERGAALVTAGTDGCVAAALNHMGILEVAAKRGLTATFAPNPSWQVESMVLPPPKAPRRPRKPRGSSSQADQASGPDPAASETIEF